MKSEPTLHYSLSKKERIASQKLVDELFGSRQGQAFTAFPLRAVYINKARAEAGAPAVQILVSVPKRRFKHAVDRNRVKRQVREAYRHQKTILTDGVGERKQMAVAFIWLSNRHCSTETVFGRVGELLCRIRDKEVGNLACQIPHEVGTFTCPLGLPLATKGAQELPE